jgi:small subunit ribosomal protein S10
MNKIKLEIKSLNKETLFQYKNFLLETLTLQNIKFSYFFLPIKKKKITVLKSTHVYKKARDQFELRQYKLILNSFLSNFSSKTLKYILLNKPKIVKIKFKINK